MPDTTLSLAIKEAYASAPASGVVYHTLEINHPAFATPIRVVRDRIDLVAKLEAQAPVDRGNFVTFVGFGFDIVPPEVDTVALPQCTIEIDNVSREILANIELTTGSPDLITCIYRQYVEGYLTAPANDPPLQLVIHAISADPFKIRATAGFRDLSNKGFPGVDYTADVFPALVGQ